MLKIAIITWNSFYNYGTCLQAYALQQYIKSLGYDNYIIDDCSIVYNKVITTKSNLKLLKWRQRWIKLWQSFRSDYRTFYHYQRILCSAINDFKSTILKVDYNTTSVLEEKADYNVYICGSDQIWNPIVLKDPKRRFYYASFTQKPKISYAPSIGLYHIPNEWKEIVGELILPFNALSVRESVGRDELQALNHQQVELVVDPTLLLSKQNWDSVVPHNHTQKDKYVLGYILTPNSEYYKTAREYAHQHGMKFYLFMLSLNDYGKADKLISGGPFDFLQYIRNAEIVFTDSYHGTIFSAIFEIPFYVFKRFSDDSPHNQNSRIDTLLRNMGAEDRLIVDSRDIAPNITSLDIKRYKERLIPLIDCSKAFLIKNLSALDIQK